MTDIYTKPTGSYISFMSNKVKTNGGINLAQGIPGFMPPKELLHILKDMVNMPFHQYAAGNGDPELVEAIISYHSNEQKISPNQLLVVQGATEALSLIYIYLKKELGTAFTTMAFDPVYEVYKNLPHIFDGNFVSYPLSSDSFNIDSIRLFIVENNVKLIYVGSPGNPYGLSYTKKQLNELIKLSQELNFYIVIDAVYKDLYFHTPPYQPIDVNNNNLFYVNSFSKMLSITGWRIGYFVCSEQNMTKIRSIHDYTGLCAPSLFQKALAKYLQTHNFGIKYLTKLRETLNNNYNFLSNELIKLGFTIPKTDGGYFVWAELPKGYSDGFKFTIDLYNNYKVAVIPGEHFSASCSNYIRFNVAREFSEIENAVEQLKKFFANC